MNQVENKGRVVALLPIGVFLVIFLGSGIVTGDFYAMPAIVAFLIAFGSSIYAKQRIVNLRRNCQSFQKALGDEEYYYDEPYFLVCRRIFRGGDSSRWCGEYS